ncbi:MAG: SWIM zinc finger family protein [Aggregatilineales bacterium]
MDAAYINKVQKSREYAEQPERVTFHTLTLEFRGDNSAYTLELSPEGWSCTCPGFQKYSICPHIMAIEKIFSPMLKRSPLPYAPGQNIVSDVKKSKRYANETDRLKVLSFSASFEGDNKPHNIRYENGEWFSSSSYFQTHGIGAYTMALEIMLEGMVEPMSTAKPQLEEE